MIEAAQTIAPENEHSLKFHLFMTGLDGYAPDMASGRRGNYVDLPNAQYSPPYYGQAIIERYLNTLSMGEHLGFDGLVVMEQRAPGSYPSAMMLATALAARTSRIRIGAVGPVLNTYLNPLRVAEEIALLDAISGGRAFFGFPLGIGPAYHHMGVDPTTARARFAEGHELVRRALTEDGPFEFRGEFYHLPVVNVFPRVHKMPEVVIPALGSKESLELAAANRYGYMAVQNPRQVLIRNVERFRDLAREHGYEASRDQVVVVVTIHVAETDAQARKEAEPHMLFFQQNLLRGPFSDLVPPGYASVESFRAMSQMGGKTMKPVEDLTFEELIDEGIAIVGSPDTVVKGLKRLVDELGAGQVIVTGDGAAMPEWLTRKSMTLFAREVIPHFRGPGALPVWETERPSGYRTIAEQGAVMGPPPGVPAVHVHGEGRINLLTSHIDELRTPLG